jgi:hypothetical protein
MLICIVSVAFALESLFYQPGRNPGDKVRVYQREAIGANSVGRSSELEASANRA